MKKTYEFNGTCSRSVSFDIDENGVLRDISFAGGCNGNLKGVSALCEGMTAAEVIDRLKGIRCGFKSTSCPDQFARALEKEIGAE